MEKMSLFFIFILFLFPGTYTFGNTKDDIEIEGKMTKVLDSRIFYREGGEGDTVLFIHGAPTSSYLWRNILPKTAQTHHVIALDLIGHGRSGKPFIEYRLNDHLNYLQAFIDKLDLRDITLVLHDWGTAIGFIYASQHPKNVKALAFMEALLGPVPSSEFMPNIAIQMRGPNGWNMVVKDNFFLEQMLPMMSLQPLSDRAINVYNKPFKNIKHRRALLMWPREVPIAGKPKGNHILFERYANYLMTSEVPKLLLYSTPGVLTGESEVIFAQNNYSFLTTKNVGPGLHFIQEEHPEEVSNELNSWLNDIVDKQD